MKIDLLDHGFVRLVEAWGTGDGGGGEYSTPPTMPGVGGWFRPVPDFEVGIIEAARQSTQGGFKGWDKDAALLKYLHDHKHGTPFHFSGMVIEVRAPIFIFREWHRHRTQCLAGDTEISLVSPRGTSFKRTIREIHDLKHGRSAGTGPACTRNGYTKAGGQAYRKPRRKNPEAIGAMPNSQHRRLRVIDEASGTAAVLPMKDVWSSGTKEIYEVETAYGLVVKCSSEHPFFTRDGWAKVSDLSVGVQTGRHGKVARDERPIPPALRSGIGVWTSMMRKRLINDIDACYVCGNLYGFDDLELDHVEPVYLNLKRALDEENLRPVCAACHRTKTSAEQTGAKTRMGVRWDRIVRIERVGEEETYDLEVDGPHHNFVANGLVVHNSYNEMSARYGPLPNLNYMPTIERLMMGADEQNRQAGKIKGAPLMTEATAVLYRNELQAQYNDFEEHYQWALAAGVPKELARIGMPVGRYSQMRAATCLRNWLMFLTLRQDPAAQWEIRQYADAVASIVESKFPQTYKLYASR